MLSGLLFPRLRPGLLPLRPLLGHDGRGAEAALLPGGGGRGHGERQGEGGEEGREGEK